MSENALETVDDTIDGLPKQALDAFGGDTLATRTWVEKYALRDDDGNLVETSPEQTWRRVAREIASVEDDDKRDKWEEEFYQLLKDWNFVPGGRILHAAGNPNKASLLNCHVVGIKEDSIDGIFDWCKDAALTYSRGGGVGTCIGPLRPRGARVSNAARESTGAVSFMDLFSKVTGTISQDGRRGALMITIPVDHPDVEEFVDIKAGDDLNNVRFANISIKLTDTFMKAVINDETFTTSFTDDKGNEYTKVVNAKVLWDRIIKSAHKSAEPGLLFWDTITRRTPGGYAVDYIGTNPCGEIVLEDGGSCCLGHVNLSNLVKNPFTDRSSISYGELVKRVNHGIRFLDSVQTYNVERLPLDKQQEMSTKVRRLGLGVTGLADMLTKLGVKYDSDEAIEIVDDVMRFIRLEAYSASISLAKEKGSFPLFNAEKHLENEFIQELPQDIQDGMREHGLRNIALLTIAPVGSGSVIARTSSGVEPIFQLKYKRRAESLTQEWHEVHHPLVGEWLDAIGKIGYAGKESLPNFFVTAHDIKPKDRVRMQATLQKYVDHSISSTCNLPRDIDVETVKTLYMEAWKQGCKGFTVYREGSREGILISEDEEEGEVTFEGVSNGSGNGHKPLVPQTRPDSLAGETYKVKTSQGNAYVTITEKSGMPFEVFVHIGRSGSYTLAFTEAIARLISLHLRSGGDMKDIIDQLIGIRGPDVAFTPQGPVYSVPDALAKALDRHIEGSIDKVEVDMGDSPECPECYQPLAMQEGCAVCISCGWERCG